MKKFIFSVLLASTLVSVLPIAAAAVCGTPGADPNNCTPPGSNYTSIADILDLITRIFGFFFAVVVALSSIFLLYAAFLYVTSRGEEGAIEKAKTIIIYAVVALVVAGIAYAIPTIVGNFVN